MQRSPQLTVDGVDIGTELQQDLHHTLRIIDATLEQSISQSNQSVD